MYEIATGSPPNARMEPGRRLAMTLRNAPKLKDEQCSEGLRDLVRFVLETNPKERPSMEVVRQQPYIFGTESTHPTSSLAELVKTYYRWEVSGGQRASLFNPFGAAAAEFPESLDQEDEWNFSTTANFEQQFVYEDQNDGQDLTLPTNLDPSESFHPSSSTYLLNSPYSTTPTPSNEMSDNLSKAAQLAEINKAMQNADIEERVKRGERALEGIFDQGKATYNYDAANLPEPKAKEKQAAYGRSNSDLPLRQETERSAVHHKELELNSEGFQPGYEMPNIDLANVNTIKATRKNRFLTNLEADEKGEGSQFAGHAEEKRATRDWTFPRAVQEDKRATMEWKFPASVGDAGSSAVATKPDLESKRETLGWKFSSITEEEGSEAPPRRPGLHHAVTAPVGDYPVVDLDAIFQGEDAFPSSSGPAEFLKDSTWEQTSAAGSVGEWEDESESPALQT